MSRHQFQLKGGIHKQNGQLFKKGDIVESDQRLDKVMVNKFQLLQDGNPVFQQTPTKTPEAVPDDPFGLKGKNKTQLKEFAEEEEIEIPDHLTKRSDIRKHIEQAMAE